MMQITRHIRSQWAPLDESRYPYVGLSACCFHAPAKALRSTGRYAHTGRRACMLFGADF